MNRRSGGGSGHDAPVRIELRADPDVQRWTRVEPSVQAALEQLATTGGGEQEFLDLVECADQVGLAQWLYCLTELGRRGWLEHAVYWGGLPVLTIRPIGCGYRYPAPALNSATRYQLAPYSHVHREDDALVLECAPGFGWIRLGNGALQLVSALCAPATPSELLARAPLLTEAVVRLLGTSGLIVPAAEAAAPWELTEWVAHRWSRSRDPNHPLGAVFPMPEGTVVPPARPRIMAMDWIEAESVGPISPDSDPLGKLLASPPVSWSDTAAPVSREQLSALLFRTQRVLGQSRRQELTPLGEVEVEYAPRPYPNGGSLYELEVYVVASQCEGLPDGVYWYDGAAHRFGRVGGPVGTGRTRLVVAGRIARRAWRYAGTAYANMLKNAGVLVEFLRLWGRTLDVVCHAEASPQPGLLSELGVDGGGIHPEETVVATLIVGRLCEIDNPVSDLRQCRESQVGCLNLSQPSPWLRPFFFIG
jgi:hypothetical protein